MNPSLADHVRDLEIRPETAAVLEEHFVFTAFDLCALVREERMRDFLDDERCIEVIRAFWAWMGMPLDRPKV